MRILATTPVSGPYVAARYRRFVEQNPHHELALLEFSRFSSEYAWETANEATPYQRIVLCSSLELEDSCKRRKLIRNALENIRPELLVLCGYGVPGMLVALHWALERRCNIPVVLLSDSGDGDQGRKIWWKEKLKQRIMSLCSSALVAGTRHRSYLCSLGMPNERIFEGYDVVDNEYFWSLAQAVRGNGTWWRRRLGLPSQFFLTSTRFLRRDGYIDRPKNLERLLEAYRRYLARTRERHWDLVILGDGELRSEVEAQIAERGLEGRVKLPGFKQYPELPAYYGLANAFVLASVKDTWGLVVNEAMASGLPVLVSERCGCAIDLVQAGRNGFTFNPYNVDELAELMCRLSSGSFDLTAMGRASREIITSRWTLEGFAAGLQNAVDVALATPVSKPTLVDVAALWALSRAP